MKFLIITHALHKINKGKCFAYEPYVREMNLWGKHINELIIVAPKSKEPILAIESEYIHKNIKFVEIPNFNLTSFFEIIRSIFITPLIVVKLFFTMQKVDHIHLRCPGNVGLLGSLVQIVFPKKKKTAKYAGNWDPKSKQPISYNIQKWLLSNTFLTKNIKVLVYGDWPNQTKNILPFFTATYQKNEIQEIPKKNLKGKIKFIFVGTFSIGKQPFKSVQVIEKLHKKEFDVELNMFGDGIQYKKIKNYINNKKLDKVIFLKGNCSKEVIKKAFQESHFLVFISKSEGWPKVVAESMFWSCLPISTNVSCVPYILGDGKRGALIDDKIENIVDVIEEYLNNETRYIESIERAKSWSQIYTLDKFELEIKKLI